MSGAKRDWHVVFSLLVVAGIFAWSIVSIATRRIEQSPPGAIILHIGHWQLEPAVREAFDELARDYQREVNPNVRIVQAAIPDPMYGQWAATQMMGGTAPDLIELWKGLTRPMWVALINRHCIPLGGEIGRPNPYNRGTDLEGVPLKLTYRDSMRSGYVEELQQYYNIPLSSFNSRVFYNKTLLQKLTGLQTPPAEWRAFLEVCRKIAQARDEQGRAYTPIAASGSAHFTLIWEKYLFDVPTYGAFRQADFNRDGYLPNDEIFAGFKSGRLSLESPYYRAKLEMVRELGPFFQTGYTGLSRDEAVFLFAQQRAVFIATGTWDARSLQEQAAGKYELGVMDFPRPTRDDPEFGGVVEGPLYDYPAVSINFAISKTCRHPEVAIDFLMYLASRRGNEKFNRIVGWIPGIRGAQMDPFLKAFEPHLVGVQGFSDFNVGGETFIGWSQLYSLYQVGQIDLPTLTRRFNEFYLSQGVKDFAELKRGWRRGLHDTEQMLAGLRGQAMSAGGESNWVKYRAIIDQRQLRWELDRARLLQLMDAPEKYARRGPYEYSARAVERVRQSLQADSTGGDGGAP